MIEKQENVGCRVLPSNFFLMSVPDYCVFGERFAFNAPGSSHSQYHYRTLSDRFLVKTQKEQLSQMDALKTKSRVSDEV